MSGIRAVCNAQRRTSARLPSMSIKPPADPGASPADFHAPAPGPSGSAGATPGQQSRRTVIVLLVVIAILLAVIAGLLLTRTPMTTFTGAPEPTPTSTV